MMSYLLRWLGVCILLLIQDWFFQPGRADSFARNNRADNQNLPGLGTLEDQDWNLGRVFRGNTLFPRQHRKSVPRRAIQPGLDALISSAYCGFRRAASIQNKRQLMERNGNQLPDADMQALNRLFRALPPVEGKRYDPGVIIKTVNALQPLGKEKALGTIEKYLEENPQHEDSREGLFLVLRVLFDEPEDHGVAPPLLLGVPWPRQPRESNLLPRFPMVIIDDVPLLVVIGYQSLGPVEEVHSHVEFYRKHGRVRSKLLNPPKNPLELLPRLVKSKEWIYDQDKESGASNSGKVVIAKQLLRLVSPVFNTTMDLDRFENLKGKEFDSAWTEIVRKFSEAPVVWDHEKMEYRKER